MEVDASVSLVDKKDTEGEKSWKQLSPQDPGMWWG